MRRVLTLALAGLFPMLPLALPAQEAPDSLATGARVRVQVHYGTRLHWVTGDFAGQTGDSIVLTTKRGSKAVARAEALAVERAVGKRSAIWTGAAIGAAVGAVAGAAWASAAYEPCNPSGLFGCPFSSSQADETIAGGVGGAFLGGLVGGIAGAVVKRTRWAPVVLPGGAIGVRAALGPAIR